MPEYILNYDLKKGIYNGYKIIFEKNNFLEHQQRKDKWWYQTGCCDRFLKELIPKTFEESDCECPSNHHKFRQRCIYSIYQQTGDYRTYLKIAFTIIKRKKEISINTYIVLSNISEIICKQKMKK